MGVWGVAPRVALVEADQAPLLVRHLFAGGDPGVIVRALATVPELAEVAVPFVGAALGPGSLSPAVKETVVLRTSAVLGCRYCVDARTVTALDVGLGPGLVAALRGTAPGERPAGVDDATAALVAWVDALAAGRGRWPTTSTPPWPPTTGTTRSSSWSSPSGRPCSSTACARRCRCRRRPRRWPAWRPRASRRERKWTRRRHRGGRRPPARPGVVLLNYPCNLACTYCLTESAPGVPRRALAGSRIVDLTRQAAALGFTELGVTGGEPFLRPELPAVLANVAAVLPTVVLSNGTLFNPARLAALRPLGGLAVRIQVSLDSDAARRQRRGPGPRQLRQGGGGHSPPGGHGHPGARRDDPRGPADPDAAARLCELHRSLGVADEDHVVRPVVRRGRARVRGAGVEVETADLPAELTITADGAFWSPFGPTVAGGVLDTDLLVTRTTDPLRIPAEALLRLVQGRPPGDDARLGIR